MTLICIASLPSLKFRILLFYLPVLLWTSSCSIPDKQAILKLEEKFKIIRDEINHRISEQKLYKYPVYKYHTYLGKGSASAPTMLKLITPELMDYVNKNHNALFEKVEEVRVFPSAGARIFALDSDFQVDYVWEKLNTGKSNQTLNRIIFMFLDFVFIYKDHLIILENDFADRELSPIHKKSHIQYDTPFKGFVPEKIHGEFSITVSDYGDDNVIMLSDTLEEKYLKGYLISRKLIYKTREIINQDNTEQTLKNSRFLQINYTDFFKWGTGNNAIEIKRLPMIWVDNWLSDRATEVIKYLDSEASLTDALGMLDSTQVLKEIIDLNFPYAILKNQGWIFGAMDRSKYYLFQSMEGKPQLTGLVKFNGEDTLFDKLEAMDINFDGWEDLAYTEHHDSLNKTLLFFMISKNEKYKFVPSGLRFCNIKTQTEEKIIVSYEHSVQNPAKFHLKFYKWENDSLRMIAQSYSKTTQNTLEVTLCVSYNCDTKSYRLDSLKGKNWDTMLERLSAWPPEW